MWFKACGHNLLPYWVWEWKPNQAWRGCLVHSHTDTLLIHRQPWIFFFVLNLQVWILDTPTSSEKIEKDFLAFHDMKEKEKRWNKVWKVLGAGLVHFFLLDWSTGRECFSICFSLDISEKNTFIVRETANWILEEVKLSICACLFLLVA